jgi:hypothetical protein
VGEWPWELIISLPKVSKFDFVDGDEVMFQNVDRQLESFFYILGIQKSDLDELPEVMFYVGEWPWELFMSSWRLKNDIVDVDESISQCLESLTNSFSLSLA